MRALAILVTATIAALVGGIAGFQLGVASNIGAAGGTVVWHAGFGGLWLFFPFLFFLLFLGGLAFAFGGRRRGWGGPGWGPGYGHGPMGDPADPRRQWIADAHRRLHEEEAAKAGTAGSPSSGATGGGTPPTA